MTAEIISVLLIIFSISMAVLTAVIGAICPTQARYVRKPVQMESGGYSRRELDKIVRQAQRNERRLFK